MTTVSLTKIQKDSRHFPTLLLLLYAIAITILFQLRTVPFTGYETDGVYYMIGARTLLTPEFRPPSYGGGIGMPIAIRLFDSLVHDTFTAAKIVSAIAGLLYMLASLKVITELFAPATGLMGGLLLLVNPIVLIYSTTSLADMLGAAWPMVALWALLDEQRRWRVFLAGLCLGLAWTTRYINVVYWPLLFAVAFRSDRSRSHTIRMFVFGVAGLILGSLPQAITNFSFFGTPFYSDNWRNIAITLYGSTYANQIHSFQQIVQQDWIRLSFMWARRLAIQIPEELFHVAYWPAWLAVPGYGLTLRNSKRRALLALWGGTIVLYLLLVAPIWRIELRYFLPILPLILASGVAMWRILVNDNKMGITIGLVVAVLISTGAAIGNVGELIASQAPEFKQAGLFLRNKAGSDDLVLASQPHVFFYAERPGVLFESLRQEELDLLGDSIDSRLITWVVFDERRGAQQFPALAWLLDPHSSRTVQLGWRLAFSTHEFPRILVWRVR